VNADNVTTAVMTDIGSTTASEENDFSVYS